MAGESYLVAGLGNIGPEYASTRHNAGFIILDAWARASNISFESVRYGDLAVLNLKGRNIYLLKPSTYMNLSGKAVRYYLGRLPVTTDRLMVVCDDINLPFGTVRMRAKGSTGGHNGLESIEEMIETPNYARIRVGIGHDFDASGQIDYVLGNFSPEELAALNTDSERIIQGIIDWIFVGIDRAMTKLNTKKG